MNRTLPRPVGYTPAYLGRAAKGVRAALFGLFVIQAVLVCINEWQPHIFRPEVRWPMGLLVVLAAATTIAQLCKQLPAQNVMLAGAIIAFIGGAVECLGAVEAIPFGPFVYTDRIGQLLFYPLPWAVPVTWLIAVLNARGVSRLILRPWRARPNYGFWLLGLTVVLVVLFDLALEPFAVKVAGYWFWRPTKLPLAWYSAPVINFFAWGATGLLILAFATPALIPKEPRKLPPDLKPVAVWCLLHALFIAGAARLGLWPAAGLAAFNLLLVGTAAWLGSRVAEPVRSP